jgi:hypothetical protein
MVIMAQPNTQPIYTKTPATGLVTVTNQVAGRDPGTAALPLLFEASGAGALIEEIRAVFLGDEATPFELRLYRKSQVQARPTLFGVLAINTVANLGNKDSGVVVWANLNSAEFTKSFVLPPILLGDTKKALRLEPFENLYVATSNALTNGVHVYAIGGQYE